MNQAAKIYDRNEYAVLSETLASSITVVVPAVPPLVKRHLLGSWRIHGAFADVLSFSRNQAELSGHSIDFPEECTFIIKSSKQEPSYDPPWFRTKDRIADTWILDDDSAKFPYTVPTPINEDTEDPFRTKIDTNLVTVTTKEPHFLKAGYVVSIDGAYIDDFQFKTASIDSSPYEQQHWSSVAWSPKNRRFVAVGYRRDTHQVAVSRNGEDWETRSCPAGQWYSVIWSEEKELFVAVSTYDPYPVGTQNYQVMTSTNGLDWFARATPEKNQWVDVAYAPALGLFVAVAWDGENRIMKSTNGINWTVVTGAPRSGYSSIAWSEELGKFCAVAYMPDYNVANSSVIVSEEGENWTTVLVPDDTIPESPDTMWMSVCWSKELMKFCAVAYNGDKNSFLFDGTTVTRYKIATEDQWVDVAWSRTLDLFVAISWDGNERVVTSPDGMTWTKRIVPLEEWSGITWDSTYKRFCIVGRTGIENVLLSISMNGDFPVISTPTANQFVVQVPDKNVGVTIVQEVTVSRILAARPDGANAVLDFGSPSALADANIAQGTKGRLFLDAGSVVYDGGAAATVTSGYVGFVAISGQYYYISVRDLTYGSNKIAENVRIRRATETWGGSPDYYIDLENDTNKTYFSDMIAILTSHTAQANPLFVGSYAYDPSSLYILSSAQAKLKAPVYSGETGITLVLDSTAVSLPSSGYITIDNGTSKEEGPIRYLSIYKRGDEYVMQLTPMYVMEYAHFIDSVVNHVGALHGPTMDSHGQTFAPYLTGVAAARNKLFNLLRDLAAAGIFIEEDVIMPEILYEDPQITIYD